MVDKICNILITVAVIGVAIYVCYYTNQQMMLDKCNAKKRQDKLDSDIELNKLIEQKLESGQITSVIVPSLMSDSAEKTLEIMKHKNGKQKRIKQTNVAKN